MGQDKGGIQGPGKGAKDCGACPRQGGSRRRGWLVLAICCAALELCGMRPCFLPSPTSLFHFFCLEPLPHFNLHPPLFTLSQPFILPQLTPLLPVTLPRCVASRREGPPMFSSRWQTTLFSGANMRFRLPACTTCNHPWMYTFAHMICRGCQMCPVRHHMQEKLNVPFAQ